MKNNQFDEKEDNLYKYFKEDELDKSFKELLYMQKHLWEYKSYDDIEELKDALLSDEL